jgi:hypothetical protein
MRTAIFTSFNFFRSALCVLIILLMPVSQVFAVPSAFHLISPEDGESVLTKTILDWEDSSDPDGPVTYTIYIYEEGNFDTPAFTKPDISLSICVLEEAAVEDNTTYSWKVVAFNSTTLESAETETRTFKTDNATNPVVAMVGGYVYDSWRKPVAGATITISKWSKTFEFETDSSGYFLGELIPDEETNPGTEEEIEITITAEGYETTNTPMSVIFDDLKETEITLTEKPIIPGDVYSDDNVDLKDAIAAARVIAGEEPSGINNRAALDQDKKIDLPELVYILRKILDLIPEETTP